MSGTKGKETGDKGIGEGNLAREPGAPPYADRAYAGETEPGGGDSPSQTGTAGGANVSKQGGGTGSDKQAGNTNKSGAGR